MTAAADLLAELRGQGFALAAEGDRIRVTPAARLTAELRERIRQHRADLLAALDLPAVPLDMPAPAPPIGGAVPLDLPGEPAELQARIDALTADPTWASRWAERLKAARYADLDAVRRTIGDMVGQAAERHRAGDAGGFHSWARFALDHAAGKHWDAAGRRPVTWPPDVQVITADEAAATFADAEAVRTGRRPRLGRTHAG